MSDSLHNLITEVWSLSFVPVFMEFKSKQLASCAVECLSYSFAVVEGRGTDNNADAYASFSLAKN